jgi:GT2 family glycosyltransferase
MTGPVTPARASLVLLNYDGRELLDQTLPSMFAQRGAGLEVVVVDNGSSDGSVAHLRERWPEVRVVALERNVGVTAALNAMVRAAGDARYVALLNNDVELEPDWTELLIACLEAHPRAAAAAGKLRQHADRRLIDRAGDELHRSGAAFGRGAGETDRGQYDTAEEVFSVGGAAALYRREAFERVGPFDEDLFAYLEDVEWGLRARLAGYEARYEPRAVGYHMGGATLGAINPFSLYHLRRNVVWLVAKDYPPGLLARHGWRVLAFHGMALAFAVRTRTLGLVLRAYRDALAGLPRALRKRRAVQRSRVISSRELERLMPARDRLW